MDQKIEHTVVAAKSAGVTIVSGTWLSAKMDWLNENHYAMATIIASITLLVVFISTVIGHLQKKRQNDIYEYSVKHQRRREDDKDE